MSLNANLICRLKSSVEINLSLFGKKAFLSREWVSEGNPHIIEREVTKEYYVVLYDKYCGTLDLGSSEALHKLTKLSFSVETRSFVGIDENICGHCLVLVNIMAPLKYAPLVISTIVSSYKSSEWTKHLTISKQFDKDEHISKLLSDSMKAADLKIPVLPSTQDKICQSSSNCSLNTSVLPIPILEANEINIQYRNSNPLTNLNGTSFDLDVPFSTRDNTNSATQLDACNTQMNAISKSFSGKGQDYLCTSDLPESIKKKIHHIDQEIIRSGRVIGNSIDEDGLPNLMDESGASNKGKGQDYLCTSDLPESIKKKIHHIDQEIIRSGRVMGNSIDEDGLPNLMDESGASNICHFLIRKDSRISSTEDSFYKDNTNDELTFPSDFLSANKSRQNNINTKKIPEVSLTENLISPKPTPPCIIGDEPVVVKDALDEVFDSLSELPKDVEIEPCPSIQCTMLPHQKAALNWMILRENTIELPPFWECIVEERDYFNLGTRRRIYEKPKSVNGGILADDMGLGKTLTTIALILTNHTNGKTLVEQKNVLPVKASDIFENSPIPKKKKKMKFNSEKKVMNKPGFVFRQMYLENLTKKKRKSFPKAENDDQMFLSDTDDDNHLVGVNSIINNLSDTLNDSSTKFSEDDKSRNGTLIICPMSVLSNWTDQLEQHVHPSSNLQIYLYYGSERIREIGFLKKQDIIITTYGTLTFDYRVDKQKGKDAPLHHINWLRIVLDEGHIIRNPHSQQTIAAMTLNASRRWILTGTVIQNRMTDLWSMLKFLCIEPFSERRWWNAHVSKSTERRVGNGKVCFNRIQKIVKHIAIRRVKTDEINGKPLVQLPKREVIIRYVTFSEEERKVYDGMQKDGKFIVSRYFHLNTIFKNYANILVIIMRLRQLCCHPKLCTKAIEKLDHAKTIMDDLMERIDDNNIIDADLNNEMNEISELDRQKLVSQIMIFLSSSDSEECSICLDILQDPVITRCAHIYCSSCINEVIENSFGNSSCPLCRSDIDQNMLLNVPLPENKNNENDKSMLVKSDHEFDDEWKSSAKIDSLMECLTELRREDQSIRSLVVSQFTSLLNIVQKSLIKAGFDFCRLDGTMKQADRVKVMDEFKSSDENAPTIMLISLTAGGVGLNLTSACRVFLLDPAWNPAVEEQCFDRCHRLGQLRDVKVYKFIVKDTVEDRMLILQEKKRKLMDKAFGGEKQSAEQRRRVMLRDISTLLDLNLNLN